MVRKSCSFSNLAHGINSETISACRSLHRPKPVPVCMHMYDTVKSLYHLNLDSTLVAASGHPQMNRAAAKASAQDSLHGLPARTASVLTFSISFGLQSVAMFVSKWMLATDYTKEEMAMHEVCVACMQKSTCSARLGTDFTIVHSICCNKPRQESWCSSTYFACMAKVGFFGPSFNPVLIRLLFEY